jgi:hypothetical protein
MTSKRPDIFRAVVLLSVPYRRRSWADIRPTEAMKQMAGERQFYQNMPGLRKKVLVPGAGHWIQQERPIEVNNLLIEFLASL